MKIPADVRRSFADVKLIRKSPTKEVLEWVAAHSTEKALSDVAKALETTLYRKYLSIFQIQLIGIR